jgi:hypothetical protein
MTSKSSPITPPPELVQQWLCSDDYPWGPLEQTSITITANRLQNIATAAAQWGADQELEACHCEVSFWGSKGMADRLQATRRPKPPSLKEEALAAVAELKGFKGVDTIRRALEQLND